MTKYFILLRHPKGFPLPIVNDNDIIILYNTHAEAKETAEDNAFAEAFGYEVMEWIT